MKLCVYAICKNEIEHIERWLDRVKEADEVVVVDTGSTDGTWEALQKSGVKCEQKIFENFRFDVARNYALSLLPEYCDICFPLDIDMFPTNKFAEKIKGAWKGELDVLYLPLYHNKTNNSGNWFCHARKGCSWAFPVYEQILCEGRVKHTIDTVIVHDRNGEPIAHDKYLQLAELGVKENPFNPYCKEVYERIKKLRQV